MDSERGDSDVELDLLPEYCHYRDDGCEFAISCLNCPFPRCVDEQPGGRQKWFRKLRDEEILRIYTIGGKGINEMAMKFGVSRRTVQRVLKRVSNKGGVLENE